MWCRARPCAAAIPLSLARTAIMLGYGTPMALNLVRRPEARGRGRLRRLSDAAAAAWPQGCSAMPGIIHDANAVLGRANRFLSARVSAIATVAAGRARPRSSACRQGDHHRHADAARRSSPLPPCRYASPEPNGPLRLLVVGGSQGARVMSDIVPPARSRSSKPRLWSRLSPDAAGARGRHGAGARDL